MAQFAHSLARFLRRALFDLPSSIGSNGLGVWFPLVPATLLFLYQGFQSGWQTVTHDLVVGAIITLISYALLFLYCVVRNIYREHAALAAKLVKSQSQLEYIQNRPRWEGYENEQAWRDAINEQNRLVNLGHLIDGRFSLLQADAFLFTKELSRLLQESMISFPERLDPRLSSLDEIATRSNERIAWRKKVESKYEYQFADNYGKLLLRFKAMGIEPDRSFYYQGVSKIEVDIPARIGIITVMVHEIDGIKLSARP
jgi:hypothetical protein